MNVRHVAVAGIAAGSALLLPACSEPNFDMPRSSVGPVVTEAPSTSILPPKGTIKGITTITAIRLDGEPAVRVHIPDCQLVQARESDGSDEPTFSQTETGKMAPAEIAHELDQQLLRDQKFGEYLQSLANRDDIETVTVRDDNGKAEDPGTNITLFAESDVQPVLEVASSELLAHIPLPCVPIALGVNSAPVIS